MMKLLYTSDKYQNYARHSSDVLLNLLSLYVISLVHWVHSWREPFFKFQCFDTEVVIAVVRQEVPELLFGLRVIILKVIE